MVEKKVQSVNEIIKPLPWHVFRKSVRECWLTCARLSCDLVSQESGSGPDAAPEPAGEIQTPGTDDPLFPA